MSATAVAAEILAELRAQRSERNIAGMRRFGIAPAGEQLGVSAPVLRAIARRHRRDHALALALWATRVHEARGLATLVDDPAQVTRSQVRAWARELDNWAVTDAAAFLFDRCAFAADVAHAYSRRTREYEKRLAFSIMAGMAVHRKELSDDVFLAFLPVIAREATDERNFVRKAVNWALRQIGKRNPRLRRAAIAEARRIQKLDSRAARWIASDALRELARPRAPRRKLQVGK
ncbi:DNA alkylation repair protein [Opitutus sp. ER46]|uniref:DNA alkylation repair protein n=1 Tax=Opitutus sp. ER46 TaxID=2161864 RepID=UPI000D309A86|nr:DNA alkylation repair protein [Opitutus sp. ER46]PTX98607.1 DNA alkylation repair protein [Opitutus sp. ER46]